MVENSFIPDMQHVVLIVDEDMNNINTLTLQLEDKDWEVYTAFSSDEAMAICRSNQVEIALVDIGVANFDGMQLAQDLRNCIPELIIVIMTGYPMVDRAVEILNHSASDYLVKPFRIEQLLMAITRARREQNLLRENEVLKRSLAEYRENMTQHSQEVVEMESEPTGEEIPLRSTEYGGYPEKSKGSGPDAIASYERQMTPMSLGISGAEEVEEESEKIEEKEEDQGVNEQST